MIPDKIIERDLDVGKWKVGVEPGHDVLAVFIKGMRSRLWPLHRVSKEDFNSRLLKAPDGKVMDSSVTRGVPSCYYHDGQIVHLWPSPAHKWTIRVDMNKRVKA